MTLETRSSSTFKRVRATRLRSAWRIARGYPSLLLGSILLALILLVAIAGPLIIRSDPLDTMPRHARAAPSAEFPFGNDASGRDILSRVVHAVRLDLAVVCVVALAATTGGTLIGLLSGYVGGLADQILMRLVDILMAFPGFLLALTVTAVLGNNIQTIVFALGVAYSPVIIRVVRAQALSLREAPFIEAARAIGTPTWEIIIFHLLPNTWSIVLAQAALFLAWAVLDIAGLSFLGLGIKPPTPELGAMTAEGAEHMVSGRWWMSVFPGVFIMLMALTFTLIGDSLRDMLDPRYRK